MQFLGSSTDHCQEPPIGEAQNNSKKSNKINYLWLGILLVGIVLLTTFGVGSPRPTFHSFLTKNQTNPNSETRFAYNDRISLYTIWNELKGTHEEMVVWITPENKVHDTSGIRFTIPPGNISFRTLASLSFTKKKYFLSPTQLIYIGTWKAKLFLDGKFLSEFSFYVS